MTSILPRSTPSAHGIDAVGILDLLDALERAPGVETHSLMLLRHGHVVAEGWWAPYSPDRPHLLYSLSKSFTSTALGLAVAEGLVSLDDTVLSHFPDLDAEVTDPRARRIRVRHVAAMASGHLSDTIDAARAIDPDDLVRGFLMIPPDREPGSVFAYNQPCTFSVAAIIQKAAGMPLTEYLRPRLLDPLGIGEVGWLTDPRGLELGFSGLHATTDAVAGLGQLYLQRGRWEGEQLLPQAWVDEATRAHVENPDEPNPDWRQGYGFQFWMARHGYRGDGAYGQFCVVLPEADVVLAMTGQSEDMQAVLDAVWEHLLAAIDRATTTPDAEHRLRDRLAAAALPSPLGGPVTSPQRTFAPGPQNAVPSITEVRVTPGPGSTALSIHQAGEEITVHAGVGAWHDADVVAAAGGEQQSGELAFDLVFVQTPHRLRIVCAASEDLFAARWVTEPLHPLALSDMRMPRG